MNAVIFQISAFIFFLFLCVGYIFSQSQTTRYAQQVGSHLENVADFSKPEGGEEFPGGAATSVKSLNNKNAFSQASANLSFQKKFEFKIGNGVFKKLWVSSPASTDASDGLGPLFNARSCQRCHLKDGRGHPPEANWPDDNAISMLIRLSIPPQNKQQKALIAAHKIPSVPEPTYGAQLHDLSIQGHNAEGKFHISYEYEDVKLAGGEIVTLRKPTYKIINLGYGLLHPQTQLSPRIAQQMIGLGLLDAISEHDVLKNADHDDQNKDGISGRANRIWSKENRKIMIGRFGWKAGQPTVREQSASAFFGDMGLSTQLAPDGFGDCTVYQIKCRNAPHGNSLKYSNVEVGPKLFNLVVFYAENLAVPKRRKADDPDILKGKELFYANGCAACHHPKFRTEKVSGKPHLSNQLIWPYTDLLLHDMGEGLADHAPEGVANGREWRTPPLWGIGLTKIVNGHTFFLHDGRARSVKEAILWHGGEAQKSRDAFSALFKEDRERLIAFVNSL
ncbi:MAG: di-heme oxidoredictase family protein [Pseudomonadota bacterium]